jgi:hypothetical protein
MGGDLLTFQLYGCGEGDVPSRWDLLGFFSPTQRRSAELNCFAPAARLRGWLGKLLELLAEGGELLVDLGEFLTEAGYFFFQRC